MKLLKAILTLFYIILAISGIQAVFDKEVPPIYLFFPAACFATIASLFSKGGVSCRAAAYAVSVFFVVLGFGLAAAFLVYIQDQEDFITPVKLLFLALSGLLTVTVLKKQTH